MNVPSPSALEDAERLPVARRLLGEQRAMAAMLGEHLIGNTLLELLLLLYIAHAEGRQISAREAIGDVGSSPNVTWRWLLSLQEDGLVKVEDRTAPLILTPRGLDRVRTTIDVVTTFS